MTNRVTLDLIFIHETDAAILVKDSEDGCAEFISKSHVDYDDTYLVPGMIGTFEIEESAAIEAGFV